MIGEVGRQSPSPRQPFTVAAMTRLIPVERLWELYDYSPMTGALISKRTGRPVKQILDRAGYSRINIWFNDGTGNRPIQRGYHQVVYAWCVGHWAIHQVDHINRDKTDNRIHNLRDITSRENNSNKRTFNSGATWNKEHKHWRAQIYYPGAKQQTLLGTFATESEAKAAYAAALERLPISGAPD